MIALMRKTVTLLKKAGETPLEAVETFRTENGIGAKVPLAYAGRLDPLASGKLLVLIGEECKKQKSYHGLDKEYVFEILLGFTSDTGDVLGLSTKGVPSTTPDVRTLEKVVGALNGPLTLPYPNFSSKTVRGKPLFLWTLENKLTEIEIPVITTPMYALNFLNSRTVSSPELLRDITYKISQVTDVVAPSKALGENFRRIPILTLWNKHLTAENPEAFLILKFTVVCGSGLYIRSLAPYIAAHLGTTGLAYSIHRTKIGRYHALPFLKKGFWFPTY